MPLDNLIPLGGISGGGGSKRGTSNDLTSGLISISGARDNADVDMSDFDVDDLLGDASSKSKSKPKDKSDDKKKKKSKDKEKSKSSSSKKKSKSKSKQSAFDDDFDNDESGGADDWGSSAKNWDSAAELEMAAAAAARRKTGSGKLGGGLDDEFAKMLGFDSGDVGSGANFGAAESPPLSPMPASTNNDRINTFATDDISGYTPTVRGSKKLDRDDAITAIGAVESGKGSNEGISASFFQDDKSDLNSASISSLLGPPTERRGGIRGGRRQTGGDAPDPFGMGSTTTKSNSTFDALFGGSSDRRSPQNDPLAGLFATPSSSKKTTHQNSREEEDESTLKPAVVEVRASTPPKVKTPPKERADPPKYSAPPSVNSNVDLASAKDSLLMDLLGDLSPHKPREPLLPRRRSSNSNDNSPEKGNAQAEDPFKRSLPSPVQLQQLSTVPEVPAEIHAISADSNSKPVTPPSPGRRRSLTMDKSALGIRESDFEQSKDSLLEEILPSSPLSISARSSPLRRNSYSQSFEVEDNVAAVVAQEQAAIEEKAQIPPEKQPSPDPPASTAPVVKSPTPSQADLEPIKSSKLDPPQVHARKEKHEANVVLAPPCNCVERQSELTAAFDIERAALQQTIDELTQQLEAQIASSTQLTQQLDAQIASTAQLTKQLEVLEASSSQLTQQLTKQLEESDVSANQLSQQLEERSAVNAQLAQQLATAQRDKLQADQLAATSKNDAAGYQHRSELLEAEFRALREELSRSKRAVQDAELTLARKTAEQDEVDQLERHREKRALEALSAQMQRALARLTVSHQVQEEGSGYDNSAARVAAEDEARLRVIASLEGSSKRAAQHAEQERTKLAELLRELEAGARNARQGALEDKERLRQEQQRLDALSAHLQAQSAALRDQEAAHATYMGQQLSEAREDARVYEARLATRRTQLERDERSLYEARAEFAAFREQTALEIEREHEELRGSRLTLEDAWRELRADREDLHAELAGHEDEFQSLESMRDEVQEAEARLAARTQEVVVLAEKLDAGTRDLLTREQLVAEQAAVVQDTDSSMVNRERALERVKSELEAREQRLHVQIRQLDNARGRLTQQRREQQQLMTATRRHYSTTDKPAVVAVDNNKLWRQSELASINHRSSSNNNFSHRTPVVDKIEPQSWEADHHIEEDPSGLPPALRKQVEANWQRRNQQMGQRRQGSGLTFDLRDFDSTMAATSKWSTKTIDPETPNYISKKSNVSTTLKHQSSQQRLKSSPSATSFRAPSVAGSQPPPPPTRSPGTFQPKLCVNL